MRQKFYIKKKRSLKNTNIRVFYSFCNFKLCWNSLSKLEELSEIEFVSEKNESLKNALIKLISEGNEKSELQNKIHQDYKKVVEEISENSNIQLISKNKNDQEILELMNDFINEYKEQSYLKKIESLEKKLINNLDENSYSELIKLKSQLNRD